MNEITINLGEIQNSCFVVMPFDSLYQTEYERIINPALEELGIKCVRGDEIYTKQRIIDDIWNSIKTCRFVIAELTGRNPNVLYEVGLAHAIGKPIIILTRNGDDVPFDLKALRYLYYDTNNPFWGENLKNTLKDLILKVLDNPQIEAYLEGIVKLGKDDFPRITSSTKSIVKQHNSIDISGTWIGTFDLNVEADIILDIVQTNSEIVANAIITYTIGTDHTIVEQNMTGSIEQNKITLIGVSYAYIRRGEDADYSLDTFKLSYNSKTHTLSGKILDEGGDGKLSVKRRSATLNTM
jgi:hypothetical protein